MKFALINADRVVNIANGDQEWADQMALEYEFVVNIDEVTPEPGISWCYVEGVFSAPVVTLAQAKLERVTSFRTDLDSYIDSKYDMNTRVKFLFLYTSAYVNGLTNRRAYIEPLHSWGSSIVSFGVSIIANIQGLTTVLDVQNFKWQIDASIPITPALTLAGAAAIPD